MLVMMVGLGVELFDIVSVFWCCLVRSYWTCHGWYIIHIFAVTDVQSRIINFTVTSFTIHLPNYPQITLLSLLLRLCIVLSALLLMVN